jgi:alpha-D-ribose 1-methylphosphonate 5-triphosphate diphosphatase
MSASTVIRNVNVVGLDGILESACVRLENGYIQEVNSSEHVRLAGEEEIIEGRGHYLIPGLVDTHNDSLETEINPRPSVDLPRSFALGNYERRALASGVSTAFHAISFANIVSKGRTIERSAENAHMAVSSATSALIDHQILHRCDVWTPEGVEPIFESMKRCDVAAISINDHMPGQGQFRDLDKFKQWIRSYRQDDSFDAEAEIRRRLARMDAERDTVASVYDRVKRRGAESGAIIVSHDDDSAEKVDTMVELGATVAEFPVTMDAARRAREQGMWITVGAPNIVRGGSTSNNLSARELVSDGLADIICGDYHTPSVILSAFLLWKDGVTSLNRAVRMITDNPARAFGLERRGRIAPGYIADLVIVGVTDKLPTVQRTMRRGSTIFQVNLSIPPSRARHTSRAGVASFG